MLDALARNWWALALRGVAAVLFGLLTFFLPGITLVTLVLLFGAYALVDGIFNVAAFFRVASHHWALLIEGVIGIIAGLLTFTWPAITAVALLYLIAFWGIFTGVFEIVAGIRLRKVIANEWLLLLMGVLSALFGLLILFEPGAGALAIVLWIGVYALMFGIVLLTLAFRLRGHKRLRAGPATHWTTQSTAAGQIAEGGDDVARFVEERRSDGGEQRSQPAEQHGSET
jgi:uncharacterized membrane protein HdeD (DUF308 family)